ncbi:MAG: hypothetical protein ACTSQY_11570, partial [Candidatus Odinarchaeia archaeon]
MINVFRIKTTSKNFTVRLFCYFYSVIMYNLWILYNLLTKKEPNKGYKLLSTQVKMLLLLKSLLSLTSVGDQDPLKSFGWDSP